jgi:hypothetical protein
VSSVGRGLNMLAPGALLPGGIYAFNS